MCKNRFVFSLHKSFVCAATLVATVAASALIAQPAWAKRVQIAFISQSALAASCKKHPGSTSYSQSGGTYGCVGKGIVECNSNTKTCTGTVTRTGPSQPSSNGGTGQPSNTGGIFGTGILEGGPVLGAQGPAATGSAMGTGGRPSAAAPIQLR
jgi:hypothetical protein